MATTKAKKIAAPIDEKETFVSLQKNMAETDAIAMEEKLRTLYKIQLTDSKIDKIHLLRGELPLEVQDLEDEIAGLQTRIAKAEDEIRTLEAANAESRHTIENAKAAISKYEEQRNNVKNNREYDSLSKEIEFQELDQQVCLKRIKENDITINEKREAAENAKQLLELKNADLEEKKKELETIVEETAKEEEELLKIKEELSSRVDQRMLVAYDRVRSNAHNHLAVVTVRRDACGGCFNKIPPQKQLDIKESRKIIVCEYCGRILVNSDFEEE